MNAVDIDQAENIEQVLAEMLRTEKKRQDLFRHLAAYEIARDEAGVAYGDDGEARANESAFIIWCRKWNIKPENDEVSTFWALLTRLYPVTLARLGWPEFSRYIGIGRAQQKGWK